MKLFFGYILLLFFIFKKIMQQYVVYKLVPVNEHNTLPEFLCWLNSVVCTAPPHQSKARCSPLYTRVLGTLRSLRIFKISSLDRKKPSCGILVNNMIITSLIIIILHLENLKCFLSYLFFSRIVESVLYIVAVLQNCMPQRQWYPTCSNPQAVISWVFV